MTWFQNHIRQDAGRFSDFWAPMSNFRTSHFLRSRENPDIYCGKLLSWLTMIQCLHASDGQSHIKSCTQILKFLAKRFKPISQILKFKSRNYCKSQIFQSQIPNLFNLSSAATHFRERFGQYSEVSA